MFWRGRRGAVADRFEFCDFGVRESARTGAILIEEGCRELRRVRAIRRKTSEISGLSSRLTISPRTT
jgi:hypothetical protein